MNANFTETESCCPFENGLRSPPRGCRHSINEQHMHLRDRLVSNGPFLQLNVGNGSYVGKTCTFQLLIGVFSCTVAMDPASPIPAGFQRDVCNAYIEPPAAGANRRLFQAVPPWW